MARSSQAQAISANVVAKLKNAMEDEESLSSDELMVVLSEAFDVIQELVALTGESEEDV